MLIAHAHARSMKNYFDHERLDVYRESISFCGRVGDLLNEITAKAAAKDQLDRASTSLPLNIAEGNGKFSAADRARHLGIARGSALESPPASMCLLCGSSFHRNALFLQKNNL
jgi:hypothetical protein